jgi:hypothetical protein
MSRRKVVIFTAEGDAHVPYLTMHLSEEPLIFDVGRDCHLASYCFDGVNPWPTVTLGGQELRFDEISGVWCRTLNYEQLSTVPTLVPEELRSHIVGGMSRMAESLPAFFRPGTMWLPGEREVVMRAVLKPYQLQLARQVGFDIPETVITTDPAVARAFLERHGSCVVKPLAPFPPPGKTQFTTIWRAGEIGFNSIKLAPQILQAVVEPVHELRVYVAGDQVFASEVWDTQSDQALAEGVRDFRVAFDNGTFKTAPYELPKAVSNRCVRFVRAAGLNAGAIDIIVDRARGWKRYNFLEINPNGQWAFVAPETVSQIGRTLTRLLETGAC